MGSQASWFQDHVQLEKRQKNWGLDQIFKDAGFEWREPGCSMCLGMNPDKVPAGVHLCFYIKSELRWTSR